uniref:Kunitz/Bovine pancreatic trypsin inhibitor domain protein n=1 Tax=Ascaris lumbricoides TaxID=6252 RepID=A0A0M3IPV8_ASCLU
MNDDKRIAVLQSDKRFLVLLIEELYSTALECDPDAGERKPAPDDINSYLYCNLEGIFFKKRCPDGKYFNETSLECESTMKFSTHYDPFLFPQYQAPGKIFFKKRCPDGKYFNEASLECESTRKFSTHYDPFLFPQYQAPDDLCDGGIPMTQLSAPIICNPSISSCPDGYICKLYAKSGTSYCCQNPSSSPLISSSSTQIFCEGNQVTYIEPSSGQPRTCELSKSGTCPIGFGCNLIHGTITRCCGKQFGCPHNSAGLINPNTGAYVQCSPNDPRSCQAGFICVKNVCPVGSPLGGGPSDCSSASKPCQHGYECITTADVHYCCPSHEIVCSQPQNTGSICTSSTPTITRYYFDMNIGLCRSFEFTQCGGNQNNFATLQQCQAFCVERDLEIVCSQPQNTGSVCISSTPAITRYYFDMNTGLCRSFEFTQCGGNQNNFATLQQCQAFCVERQCAAGAPYRVNDRNALCTPSSSSTCPNKFKCEKSIHGSSSVCCPTPEMVCTEAVTTGTPCFGSSITTIRFFYNSTSKKCESFKFFGCSANHNNFASKILCERFCFNNDING